MTEIDERVRELLHRKVEDIPPHGEMPSRVAGRARRRIAANAVGVALGVAVVLGGASAGLRFVGTGAVPPTGGGSTRTPPPSGPTICTATDLQIGGSVQGAMGSREGMILLTNNAGAACTLEGRPTITLLDQDRQPITSGVTFAPSEAQWQADAQPGPPGWPEVTVGPRAAAQGRPPWANRGPGRPAA